MPKTRKCAYCGKVFTTNSGMQKYCSEKCAEQAKETKKKRQRDFLRAVEPVSELQQQEYLTFSKAAILLGCTRQYIYKLVEQGKLPASRLSSRMALVRKSDIEKMFEDNPYNRVLPCTKPKKAVSKKMKSPAKDKAKEERATDEVLEYYSGEEVKQIYKVKQSWLYHIDAVFGTTIDLDAIVDWLSPQEVADHYGINLTAVRSYAHRHKIPTKREYGCTYYSQSHFDELRRTDLLSNENYYTVEQVQQLYGLTKANICHIVKVKHIEKTKVGRLNLLLRSDVERVMEERKSLGMMPAGY